MKRSMAALLAAACLAWGPTSSAAVARPDSRASTKGAALTISAAASPTRIVVGSSTTITGKVSVHLPNSKVDIERKVDGVWQYRTSTRVDSTNTFRATIRPSQKGSYALRVRYPFANVASKTFYVQVYAGMGGISGHGEGSSRPISFSGGTYYVIGSYYDTGYCSWYPSLRGITDKSAYEDLPSSSGSSTRTYLYDVAPGSYYIDMLAGGEGSCTWAITFYRL